MRALAFSVHVFTALGAALALLALFAATRGDWTAMFLWLGVALFVDGVDGPLARAFNVKNEAARWSGDILDLVVDFTTYVFVPAYAVAAAGLMPAPWSLAAGCVIGVTGALYFADNHMKTADNYFLGFPAVWNLIAFYLLMLRPGAWIAAAIVAFFAVLTFVPIRFVHPLRVRHWRAVTVSLLVLWAVLAAIALGQGLMPSTWVAVGLCLIAAYFFGLGLVAPRPDPT